MFSSGAGRQLKRPHGVVSVRHYDSGCWARRLYILLTESAARVTALPILLYSGIICFSAEVKNEWSYASTPRLYFYSMDREYFTLFRRVRKIAKSDC